MSLKSLQTFSRNVAARKGLEDADAVRSLGTLFRIMFKWTKPEETLNASNLFFFTVRLDHALQPCCNNCIDTQGPWGALFH